MPIVNAIIGIVTRTSQSHAVPPQPQPDHQQRLLNMKAEFLLEPDVVFLNHGSFGACPRVVHAEYQRLQLQLESQPVRFLQREFPDLIHNARARLATYIGADTDEVVFVANPTFAANEIAKSLQFGEGDELLCTNHEYGACRNAWQSVADKCGFEVTERPLPLTATSSDALADLFWSGVSDKTKAIFISHISSPTALTFPVEEICRRASQRDILTIIDGAHAPGQLSLNMHGLGVDFYIGTCHKWMCAPKGSAFFYAKRERQDLIEPLVVGWGWGEDRLFNSGNEFVDAHHWLGTHDPAAYLSVPAAIDFQEQHDWDTVRTRCHELAVAAVEKASTIAGVTRVHDDMLYQQMGLVELHDCEDPSQLKQDLYEHHRIELPATSWNDRNFLRISVQAYNSEADIDAFVSALRTQLGQ